MPRGRLTALFVPLPNCSSVQASRPLAAEGLSVSPGGSVTLASLTWAVPSDVGVEALRDVQLDPQPGRRSRLVVAGLTEIDGAKGSASQPVAASEWCR